MRFAAIAISALATCAFALPAPAPVLGRGLITDVIDFLHPSTNLNGLCAEGAAAFVGACIGLKAEVIDANAKAKLAAWISGADIGVDADVKAALGDWCTGSGSVELDVDVIADLALFVPYAVSIAVEGGFVVDVNGVSAVGAAVGVILETSFQSELDVFLKANLDLDSEINVGLNICAAGGVVSSLTADVKAAITAYLGGSECGLSASLKAAVGFWLEGQVGSGCVSLGSVSTTASVSGSIGVSIDAAVDVDGILSASYISALEAWISAQTSLNVNVKGWLEVCTGAKGAISLDIDAVGQLTAWLFTSDCTLTAELKAAVLLWLHVRVGFAETISVLGATDITTLSAWIKSESSSLSATVTGALSVACAGEAVVNVDVSAIAEVSGLLTGCVSGFTVPSDIQVIIAKWTSGETCDCHWNAKRALPAHA